jgi:Zn ribbon nucleic-acid-binding protein
MVFLSSFLSFILRHREWVQMLKEERLEDGECPNCGYRLAPPPKDSDSDYYNHDSDDSLREDHGTPRNQELEKEEENNEFKKEENNTAKMERKRGLKWVSEKKEEKRIKL